MCEDRGHRAHPDVRHMVAEFLHKLLMQLCAYPVTAFDQYSPNHPPCRGGPAAIDFTGFLPPNGLIMAS